MDAENQGQPSNHSRITGQPSNPASPGKWPL